MLLAGVALLMLVLVLVLVRVLREGISQLLPARHTACHLLGRQQTCLQLRLGRRVVELQPNAHELSLARTVLVSRLALETPTQSLTRLAPWRPRHNAELRAGEVTVHLVVVLRGEPEHTLDTNEAPEGTRARAAAKGRVQPLRVEGARRAEDER